MVYGSIERPFKPKLIHYQEAMLDAVIGLVVNLVSARILNAAHHHGDEHGNYGHAHEGNHHHDLNLSSAYLHVMADAANSVAAIAALAGGWLFGWSWLDPLMGIVGAAVVAI